jgi:hypothetical protein
VLADCLGADAILPVITVLLASGVLTPAGAAPSFHGFS